MDGSKRITLIKEVAEILDVGPQDHLMFYIDNGEVIIRRVLPESSNGGIRYNNDNFREWARKREIEIGMMEPECAEVARNELEELRDSIEDLEKEMDRIRPSGGSQ